MSNAVLPLYVQTNPEDCFLPMTIQQKGYVQENS
jgi:hypothetical protein